MRRPVKVPGPDAHRDRVDLGPATRRPPPARRPASASARARGRAGAVRPVTSGTRSNARPSARSRQALVAAVEVSKPSRFTSISISRRSPPRWRDLHAGRHALELRRGRLGPLHEADPLGRQVVVEQRGVLAGQRLQAVEVEVRDLQRAAAVELPDREGRARDRVGDAEGAARRRGRTSSCRCRARPPPARGRPAAAARPARRRPPRSPRGSRSRRVTARSTSRTDPAGPPRAPAPWAPARAPARAGAPPPAAPGRRAKSSRRPVEHLRAAQAGRRVVDRVDRAARARRSCAPAACRARA